MQTIRNVASKESPCIIIHITNNDKQDIHPILKVHPIPHNFASYNILHCADHPKMMSEQNKT